MRRVVLESPYAGDVAGNIAYARRCVRDCLMRNEAPLAAHLLYTQDGIFRDDIPAERAIGIAAGHAWISAAEALVVYIDRGITPGMKAAIELALKQDVELECRSLPQWLAEGVT